MKKLKPKTKKPALKEGVKMDNGKVRMDLIPPEFMFALALILTKGAEKYADRNWEKGMGWGRVFAALMRHLWAWWGGKATSSSNFLLGDLDPEWKFSHLWHAAACLCFLLTYEERKMYEHDDRFSTIKPRTRTRTGN